MVRTNPVPVREVMSRDLVIVNEDDNLSRVNDIFQAYNIHHLPVVNEEGKLCGIISKSDQSRADHLIGLYNQNLYEELTAADVMTRQVATIGPDETLEQVAEAFLANVFHALPVVDRGNLVGIITTHDLVRFCFTDELLLEE